MLPIVDSLIVGAFLVITLFVGLFLKTKDKTSAGYLLGGRALTLPAFIATTVSTWYGGILGIGEYGYSYGISNWLVFGVPYYVGALLFALILCKRAREGKSLTLPEHLSKNYGPKIGVFSSILVFLTGLPAAYMLILGTLLAMTFGVSQVAGVVLTAIFIVVYLWRGGFSAVTKTDFFQCIIMFGGFILLSATLLTQFGLEPLETLPATHWEPSGGQSIDEILIWYIIALSTLTEPNFFQRAFAAKTPKIARNGLLISILCWIVFDAMTTLCALYARALLPNLENPLHAFPALAQHVLPSGLLGLFFVGMFATVMSTLDSKIFTAATTFGKDFYDLKLLKSFSKPDSAPDGEKTSDQFIVADAQNVPDTDSNTLSQTTSQKTSKNFEKNFKNFEDFSSKNGSKLSKNSSNEEKVHENLKNITEKTELESTTKRTRIGLVISALCAALLALASDSVVEIWKIYGSISAAALLIPIVTTYYKKIRMTPTAALLLMSLSTLATLTFFALQKFFHITLFGIRPLFAGFTVSLIIYIIDLLIQHKNKKFID